VATEEPRFVSGCGREQAERGEPRPSSQHAYVQATTTQ
jgi:hypothetical protein